MSIKSFFQRAFSRGFLGANINRHTADWVLSPIKTNEELKRSLPLLILRSRDLAKNNSYMKKYLSLRADNITGPDGIGLQMRIKNLDGKPDDIANASIEKDWFKWGRKINKFATACGTMGFVEFCRLVDRTLAVDGECFVQKIKGAANPYGFALRIIDSLDIDVTYNVENLTTSGSRIIMGVELDKYDKPIAYHTRENKTGSYYGGDRIRIPASEIIHLFEKEYPGQARGIPHASAAIMDLNQLNGYQEAELIGARIGACQMGIWKRVQGLAAKILGDNPASDGVKESYDMEPGAFMKAPNGYELQQLLPTHPGGNFEAFCKAVLRRLAGSLGVSYNLFASDLETVNFSSLRSGALTERDTWTTKQNFFIENFVEEVFYEWLQMYLLSGLSTLPFSKLDKFHQPEFKGRRWAWVDPKKDLEAAILAIDNGLKDPQAVIADMGADAEYVLDNLAAWKKMKEARGVVTVDNSNKPPQLPQPDNAADNGN